MFHHGLARPVLAGFSAARQHIRHRRHGDSHRHYLGATRRRGLSLGRNWHRGRRSDWYRDRLKNQDDRHAAISGGVSQLGRPRRCLGRCLSIVGTRNVSYSGQRRYPLNQSYRTERRHGDRRDDVYRFDYRLCQTAGVDDRFAGDFCRAASVQSPRGASNRCPGGDLLY